MSETIAGHDRMLLLLLLLMLLHPLLVQPHAARRLRGIARGVRGEGHQHLAAGWC